MEILASVAIAVMFVLVQFVFVALSFMLFTNYYIGDTDDE